MKQYLASMMVILLLLLGRGGEAQATGYAVVTASNDEEGNELLIFDSEGMLLQSLPTEGKGGVGPHIVGGGIAQFGPYLAVINYNSRSISLFKRQGDTFKFLQQLRVRSNPVSVAFGHNHLYVLGTTTIESHRMNGDYLQERPDGYSDLLVADGSAAQVGVLVNKLIVSERSNMIELVDLRNGAVTDHLVPVQLPPPPRNDTPVGLTTKGDIAYVTIAHSNLVGVVNKGKLVKVISSENQNAPCWLALTGSSLYCSNTPSKSISRYLVSNTDINLDKLIAVQTEGEPTDIDAMEGVIATIEFGEGGATLRQYQIDEEGNVELKNSAFAAKNANGVAIIKRPMQRVGG